MKKNIIKEKIEYYRADTIADKLGVSKRTIYRWINDENINQKKFIEFLYLIEIDPLDYIKKDKEKDGK